MSQIEPLEDIKVTTSSSRNNTSSTNTHPHHHHSLPPAVSPPVLPCADITSQSFNALRRGYDCAKHQGMQHVDVGTNPEYPAVSLQEQHEGSEPKRGTSLLNHASSWGKSLMTKTGDFLNKEHQQMVDYCTRVRKKTHRSNVKKEKGVLFSEENVEGVAQMYQHAEKVRDGKKRWSSRLSVLMPALILKPEKKQQIQQSSSASKHRPARSRRDSLQVKEGMLVKEHLLPRRSHDRNPSLSSRRHSTQGSSHVFGQKEYHGASSSEASLQEHSISSGEAWD